MERYRSHEGVIVGRKPLPGGDVLLRFVGPEGTLDAVARKAQRPGGRSGRLMLFHHVRFQAYHKPDRELVTLTQAELVGRLERLSEPGRYAAAAYLGELAYRLAAPDAAPAVWPVFTSGLRGVARHSMPTLPLVWAGWRMLAAGGIEPALASRCGHAPVRLELEGTLACTSCARSTSVPLGPEGAQLLAVLLRRPGKEAIARLEAGSWRPLLAALLGYVAYQLEPLRSEPAVRKAFLNGA